MSNTGKVDVLLGAQWGDEGKGKVVDLIAPKYGVIARFQGGPNAGHTLFFEGTKHVLHTIPSGVFHNGMWNLIGNGVVIDPIILMNEIRKLEVFGINVRDRLMISRRAHLILPTHRALDAASEAEKGKGKIGSTLKGIGPTYMDKTGRNGFRVGDLERADMKDRYRTLVKKHERLLAPYEQSTDWRSTEPEWLEAVGSLSELRLIDSEHWLDEQLRSGTSVLAEGAQGTMLDIDFGTYPFVTSSNTITAGACTGLGISPLRIGRVMGVFKAYSTRVGSGPFPTELIDGVGDRIRKIGQEVGSTTGRDRRCGWLDLPALKYSAMVNGLTELIMTKADVLNGFDEVRVCTHYRVNGRTTDCLPYDITDAEPVYATFPGWDNLNTESDLPDSFGEYVGMIEKSLGVPVRMVSTGPERNDMLYSNTSHNGHGRSPGGLLDMGEGQGVPVVVGHA